jgi:prolyl oligopeptidase PreP (S9A serine peptidase family)
VKAQNEVTFGYLDKIPFRQKIFKDLERAFNYPKYSAPSKKGDYFYFYKNDGLQNQAVLYRQKGLAAHQRLFWIRTSFRGWYHAVDSIQFVKRWRACSIGFFQRRLRLAGI